MKRWGNMARVFTKLGKEITIAVKAGGPEPETNPRLRVLMQTAKKENMPKENVERAIKKASSKDFSDYKEMNYEGYGPFGIAIFVETATDNTTRTVANVRSYFNKFGGSLGTSGSLEFLFDHKCIFHIVKKEGMDLEELELARERAALVLESEDRRRSERMNRTMYRFGIITCIFLPMSFITGLLGINVGGIPGSDSPYGFLFASLIVLGLAAGQWLLFRRLRWV